MRTRRLRTLSLVALLAPVACTESVPTPVLAPPEPGLAVEPSWLTFTCVRPGCDTKLAATVKVVGDRDLAVKRVVLSDRDRTDITLQAGRQPPFILKASETFAVEVSYKPTGDPRLGDVEVLVTYTDASASEEADRVKAGELKIPLVRRLVGEPTLQVSPEVLDFGPVLPGARKTLPLTISNVGFGNVGLVLESIRSDLVDVSISNMPSVAILPMDTWNVDVTFAPQDESYTAGSLTVRSADPAAPTPVVRVVGTSIPRANILVEPARGVDFGEVPRMMSGTARMTITNQGAEDLLLSAVEIVNAPAAATLDVRLPRLALTTPLRPLASITATLTLSGMQAGPVDARVRVTSSDVLSPITEIPVLGIITEPNVLVGPPALEFGAVPRGWVVTRPIEVVNSGYGDLVITGVSMVLGSSELFTLRSVSLPVTLRHDQRTALEVEFRSEVEAPLTGKVSIDTNDPDQPFVEVDLRATGASCDLGCPIANGTPTCTGGACAIDMCNVGFYDTDRDPVTGCECAEVGRDPGAFCQESQFVGTLADDGARQNASGIISTADDQDLYRFFGLDETQFLSDDYDVRIRLESGDPGIEMCVYRHDVAAHESACLFENETCGRSYRRDGSWPGDDSADYIIRVRRTQSSAPTCISYTVFMSND
jgi:hypothetical protein